jgi:hypothetical protein
MLSGYTDVGRVQWHTAALVEETRRANFDQTSHNASHHMTWPIDLISDVSSVLQSMALPLSLQNSVTPPELELIASEELVEIIPLISMERTAFISV